MSDKQPLSSQSQSNTAPRRSPMMASMGRGGPMMQGPAEKPKDFKGTMRALFKYLRQFRFSVAAVIIFAIASTVFTIISPKLLGDITNKIVNGYVSEKVYDQVVANLPAGTKLAPGTTGSMVLSQMPQDMVKKIPASELDAINNMDFSRRPGIDYSGIARIIEILVGIYLLGSLFSYIQGWIMTNVSQRVTFNMRRDISLKINKLPLRYFDSRTHGEILSRVTNDVTTVSQTLNQSLTQIITAVTTIIGILAMMLTISWQMTLVAILVLPASFGLLRAVIGKSQKYFVDQQVSLGKINGHIEEMFSGHTIMKAFNGQQRSIAAFRNINGELYDSAWKSQFLSGLLYPITNFVGNLSYVAVAVLGGWFAW
ncbi:MAG: ABC transporter ATP-binding protein [Patescibacteria group bacterium]|nr:ABC transporter ATP-binding protein [Patescibacteria group bacterium]